MNDEMIKYKEFIKNKRARQVNTLSYYQLSFSDRWIFAAIMRADL